MNDQQNIVAPARWQHRRTQAVLGLIFGALTLSLAASAQTDVAQAPAKISAAAKNAAPVATVVYAQKAAASGEVREWSKDELIKKGEAVYATNCAACHQAGGQGLPPAFPPLTKSKVINDLAMIKDGKLVKDGHIDRVMHGKAGTAMQAYAATLSDDDLAAVITYERNALGNSKGDWVQPAMIKSFR